MDKLSFTLPQMTGICLLFSFNLKCPTHPHTPSTLESIYSPFQPAPHVPIAHPYSPKRKCLPAHTPPYPIPHPSFPHYVVPFQFSPPLIPYTLAPPRLPCFLFFLPPHNQTNHPSFLPPGAILAQGCGALRPPVLSLVIVHSAMPPHTRTPSS